MFLEGDGIRPNVEHLQCQWWVEGKIGAWETFTSCDNVGDNEVLENRYQEYMLGGSEGKIELKLKRH